MPDLPIGGTEAAGFEPEDPPGEWLDDLAAASLSAMRAEHEGATVTAPAGVTRWTTTRAGMIEALRETRSCQHMTLEALGALADAVLARLPEAETPFRNAEIARLRQDLADKDGELAILRGQVTQ